MSPRPHPWCDCATGAAAASPQELCRELDSKQDTYCSLRERLQRLLGPSGVGQPCSTEHGLRLLQHKWESVRAEAQERKVRGE